MSKTRAGIDIDELTKALDDLCSEVAPSDVIIRIHTLENEHLQYVLDNYQRFVSQTEAYLDLLLRAVHHVNYIKKSEWPPHKTMQFILTVHNLKPIFSGFDRLLKGYYEDCEILLRTSYEAFFRLVYISLNPDDPYHSFAPRKKGIKQFNLTNFINQQLELDWHDYNVMSSIAHANKFNALSELKRIASDGQKKPITPGIEFDEFMFSIGVNQIGYLLLVYLRIVTILFLELGKETADLEMKERCKRYSHLSQQFFASHINPHLQILAKDVEDISQMLTEVEAGKDWETVWKRLRSA